MADFIRRGGSSDPPAQADLKVRLYVLPAMLLVAAIGIAAASTDVADAVERGDTTALRRLLTQKADVNVAQADGGTALHWAVYRDDLATVDLLVKAGARVAVANQYGATPLSLAAESGKVAIAQRLLDAGAGVLLLAIAVPILGQR